MSEMNKKRWLVLQNSPSIEIVSFDAREEAVEHAKQMVRRYSTDYIVLNITDKFVTRGVEHIKFIELKDAND
jgi:hypothetical protein